MCFYDFMAHLSPVLGAEGRFLQKDVLINDHPFPANDNPTHAWIWPVLLDCAKDGKSKMGTNVNCKNCESYLKIKKEKTILIQR